MDLEKFRKHSEDMLDYVIHYYESVSHRSVNANVCPGYLKDLLPEHAPDKGEAFETIMEDVEKYIMPGIAHWHHPGFHAYYPSISSFTSVLGTLINASVGGMSLNLHLSPAARDLETIVADWFGKMIGLPDDFLSESETKGGGILQGTVSECLLFCLIAARQKFVMKASRTLVSLSKPMVVASLIAYTTREAHSCFQKAAVLSLINVKYLDTDENFRLRGDTLAGAIKEDKSLGLLPFFVNVTIGTPTGACDPLEEIGPICKKYGLWLHVDASYGGNAFVCPEYRESLKGIEYASTFTINPAKWFMVHLDCSIVYAKNIKQISEYMMERCPLFFYVEEDWSCQDWKAFRAFKFWMTIRNYGIEGFQKLVRNHFNLAKVFEGYVREDNRFEVVSCNFGVVCFRLKGTDEINKALLKIINTTGKLLLNSYGMRGKMIIRFVVCSEHANENDVLNCWTIIREITDQLTEENLEKNLLLKTREDSFIHRFP